MRQPEDLHEGTSAGADSGYRFKKPANTGCGLNATVFVLPQNTKQMTGETTKKSMKKKEELKNSQAFGQAYRRKRFALLFTMAMVFACFAFAPGLGTREASARVADGYMEYKENYAGLKWAVKLGEGWQSSPTPPAVHGDFIYVAKTTEVVKIRKDNGKIVKSAKISKGQKFTIIPIEYIEKDEANGLDEDVIAVPLYNGKVQFFTAENLAYMYTTEGCAAAQKREGLQLTTHIKYDNGYIYFGTWYGDVHDGYFYCYKVGDEKPLWTVTKKGGFYLSNPCITEDYVCFGSDNGLSSAKDGNSTLFVCKKGENPEAGESPIVYKDETTMEGNCRAAVVSDGENLFAVTQAGKAYRFKVNPDGALELKKGADLGAPSTGEATIYNGVIYYCLSNSELVSLDTENMVQIDSINTPGYVQGGIALSEAKAEEGSLYLYGSYNKEPAGLFAVMANTAGEFESMISLFRPPTSMKQFNMTPITLEGSNIYYRNDSGNIMALESGYTLWTEAGSGGTVQKGLSAKEGSSHSFNITPKDGYKCVDIIVDGVSNPGATTYRFENVTQPHELKAVFMKKTAIAPASIVQSRYDKLTIKWSKTDGATAYEIYRAIKASGPYTKRKQLTGCTFTDTGCVTGKQYFYKVKGIYKRGSVTAVTAFSKEKGGKTILPKTTATAKAQKGRKALIKWKKVAGATGYEIFRSLKKSGSYKKVATIKKGATIKWTNKKLKKGKKYYYKIKAVRKTKGGTARSAFSNISYCKAKK